MSQFAVRTPSVPAQRPQPIAPRGEREVLVEYLDYYREALERKTQGLSVEQMGLRSVPPSRISMLGLVRHLARVEHHWFRRVIGQNESIPRLFEGPEDDGGFGFGPAATDALVYSAWETWRFEVSHSRGVLRQAELSDKLFIDGQENEVRDVLVHLIEEYARHLGHADLVRECIDGVTGH